MAKLENSGERGQSYSRKLPLISYTYFCGWDGSSPKETVSPGMSLKHFWQKLYLSENKAGVGFLQQIFIQYVVA